MKKPGKGKETNITSVLRESRIFKPPADFSKHAHIRSRIEYKKTYEFAKKSPVKFWKSLAENLFWFKKWTNTTQGKGPDTKWFVNGKTNVCYNALDVHLTTWRKNKAAIIFEEEQGNTHTVTYSQLHKEVCKFANVLKKRGIKKGDRVIIYMGMSVELTISLLACARLGAIHSVVFGGFSSHALADRINNVRAKVVVCADGVYRRGAVLNLKNTVNEALKTCPGVKSTIVYQRTKVETEMIEGRDYWWHDLMKLASQNCEAIPMDSEDPLFILYTSGSTGKPKGIVHTTGGYMVYAYYSYKNVFDIKDEDVYWCTADIGWITGHSYIVYGPMTNGATQVIYEGALNYPNWGRVWEIIERHRVNILYTAPTAIRSFIRAGDEWITKSDLSSLRLLGTVGEPINPEAWMWYYNVVGQKRCPIVDTWWQTETGGIMISPLPGATYMKPGSATKPLPGISIDVVKKDGTSCKANEGGLLVIKEAWPSMARTIYKNHKRFIKTYWSEIPGYYLCGDSARRDKNGDIWIMGRIDDVVNISGHRLGTSEVESALVSHESVAEAAVASKPDEIKGNALVAFVTLKAGNEGSTQLKNELINHVVKEIGSIAKPDQIRFTEALPKTRSGKIMRRLLKEIAVGEISTTSDTSTLEDYSALEKLRQQETED